MADTTKPNVTNYTPDKQLEVFARGRIWLWAAVAVLIHILLIGGFSISYIRDTWIDPQGAVERKAAVEAQKQKASEQAAAAKAGTSSPRGTNAPVASVTNAPGAVPPQAGTTNASPPAQTRTDQQLLDERKGTPVVQRITEVATSNEIPKGVGDISLQMDDAGSGK